MKIATQRMTSMPQSEETVELTEKTASDITTQLENVQSCGETTLLEEAAFEIELDITYIGAAGRKKQNRINLSNT